MVCCLIIFYVPWGSQNTEETKDDEEIEIKCGEQVFFIQVKKQMWLKGYQESGSHIQLNDYSSVVVVSC